MRTRVQFSVGATCIPTVTLSGPGLSREPCQRSEPWPAHGAPAARAGPWPPSRRRSSRVAKFLSSGQSQPAIALSLLKRSVLMAQRGSLAVQDSPWRQARRPVRGDNRARPASILNCTRPLRRLTRPWKRAIVRTIVKTVNRTSSRQSGAQRAGCSGASPAPAQGVNGPGSRRPNGANPVGSAGGATVIKAEGIGYPSRGVRISCTS